MVIKTIIYSFLLIVCAGFSWIASGMEPNEIPSRASSTPLPCSKAIPLRHKARIPALLALREVPSRPGTPVSMLQKTILAKLVDDALNNSEPTIELEFGEWLANILRLIPTTNKESRTKLAHFLQASVGIITAKKVVAKASVDAWTVEDIPVISPMIEILVKQQTPITRLDINYIWSQQGC